MQTGLPLILSVMLSEPMCWCPTPKMSFPFPFADHVYCVRCTGSVLDAAMLYSTSQSLASSTKILSGTTSGVTSTHLTSYCK